VIRVTLRDTRGPEPDITGRGSDTLMSWIALRWRLDSLLTEMEWVRYPGSGSRERRMRRWHVLKAESDTTVSMACGLNVWAGIGTERTPDRPAGELCERCSAFAKRHIAS
jgi:hypothetical protein